MRGVNDDEVVDLARFGRERGVEVRFIEFMPLDGDGQWSLDRVVPAEEIVERLDKCSLWRPWWPARRSMGPVDGRESGHLRPGRGPEPADRYRYLDGVGVRGRHRQRDQAFLLEL